MVAQYGRFLQNKWRNLLDNCFILYAIDCLLLSTKNTKNVYYDKHFYEIMALKSWYYS